MKVVADGSAVDAVVDAEQIRQVILNLLDNARKSIRGVGTITVSTSNAWLDERFCEEHPELQPGRYARLTVTDTGEGMTDEVKTHLFEPFFTTRDVGHGEGLGLATTFGIIKQHEGHVIVHSKPGKGSSFEIYFPWSASCL